MDIAAQITDLTVDIAVRGGRAAPVVRVLNGADLALPAGDITALIGESGCGKSLVALALCGLLPASSRISGGITIGDDDMSAAGERAWRQLRGRRVGLAPQSAATSFTPVRTVGSQVAEVCRRVGAYRTAEQLFAAVRLPDDVGDRYPHELSGGMAQRAAIAAALAGRPELLIADEPTSALDPDNAATVWKLLAEAAADGAAVLVITHDLASLLAADACGQVALMRDGAVLRQGPVVDLLDGHDDYAARFFDRVPA